MDFWVSRANASSLLECLNFCRRFTGSAGVAVVSKTSAYLVTDSRYWLQAQRQIDRNWLLVAAGSVDGPKDWIEWLVDRASECRIGIDARMLSHEKAVLLNNQLAPKRSKLYYPPQNFVDLIWKDKPSRSREPVFVQPLKFTGMEAGAKIAQLRQWIQSQPPTLPSYTKRDAIAGDKQVCTLLSSLSSIGKFGSSRIEYRVSFFLFSSVVA